ncbi:molecular chaperone, partial [Paraburkholderia sediminicola]|nr:molecular chaperone [Paraburkholderia sediminicola]
NTAAGQLQLVFRTRIKVLFRPDGLPGAANESPTRVTWAVVPDTKGKYALKATNPTAYFVNLGEVSLTTGGKHFKAAPGFIGPGESQLFPVADLGEQPGADAKVSYTSINDYGAGVSGEQPARAGSMP